MRALALLLLFPSVASADPEVVRAPAGFLLPGAQIYARSDLDTRWAWDEHIRLGLGDVAEFGLSSGRDWHTAQFRMGLRGLALGFEKSFARDVAGQPARFAQLHLVYSRTWRPWLTTHSGAGLWDAARGDVVMHDGPLRDRVRAFGGVEVSVVDRSSVIADVWWDLDFCLDDATSKPHTTSPACMRLVPIASVGVRYYASDAFVLTSGMRLADDTVSVFGQLSVTNDAFRRFWLHHAGAVR